ncbi:MAG: alpha-glucan family phosphorylase, partial [Alistipes sp.]|nr:alpha-glucan family phosphorylase [Alistipes sp.]
MSNVNLTPDYLFEVSWEVCNKVGGIHTVIASKAPTVKRAMGDSYITVGPDFSFDAASPEFMEDNTLMAAWREELYSKGVRVRIGRWNIESNPIAILIDFKSFIREKDNILKQLWESYNVDSLSGQWDYVEPVLFGHAAGVVIASFVEHFGATAKKVVAHFHEWMASAGSLYLRDNAPYVATVFSTHATVMGRCIAGNHLPLYNDLHKFNADELARQFNVMAKHSLEKAAATYADAFLTVSDITANECKYLMGREVTRITPNGFENGNIPTGKKLEKKREEARKKLLEVATATWDYQFQPETLIVGTSGRYEYRNKGIDVFLESLKQLAASNLNRDVLAVIAVPAANTGARQDLIKHLENKEVAVDPAQKRYLSHGLENEMWDQVSQSVEGSILYTSASRVKVLFIPTYLNGQDGIFNMPYYDVLSGMDLTVFASYYEPWGYTPLESVAYGVPTVTTTLAGFGMWVAKQSNHNGVDIVRRDDYNEREVVLQITDVIRKYIDMSAEALAEAREAAQEVSTTALWKRLYNEYKRAYEEALDNSVNRTNRVLIDGGNRGEQINFVRQQLASSRPTWHRLMVEKRIPERLKPLEELSRNLWWCWTVAARDLFESVDEALWVAVDRNPIALLDKLSSARCEELCADKDFLKRMDAVYKEFTEYMSEKPAPEHAKVSYFSMEYGLHSSLKIYSGGLGILAGDYLKEASDRNVGMVAVGLLYRYGYFTQRLSAQGAQEATYEAQNFFKLPISPVRDEFGNWVTVQVALPGRTLSARVWKCAVGRTDLYLLDADYEANLDEDRQITYYLYGGDWENRLKQEILLGVGGIRALVKMGIKQEVYHCNEGHAAFIGLERIRNLITKKHLSFSEALEVVRSSSLFTTHTPVPAGHDAFPEYMIRQYMSHYPDVLGITWDQFINLGKTNPNDPNEKFSMSVLACNLSQEVNGVSWLHGEVSKEILGNMWPGYFKNELHIGYVTNGVHFPTWVASNLRRLYAKYFGSAFEGHTYNIPEWQNVHKIDDNELWQERMFLKNRLIKTIRKRFSDPTQVRLQSPRQMVQVVDSIKPEVLTIGFARRFATYKRAHLLFTNLERLSALVNNKERPVQFIFAGKAHP